MKKCDGILCCAKTIIDICLILCGLGWVIIGIVNFETILSNSDVNNILNIFTILLHGLCDDIKILSGLVIGIGLATIAYAGFGFWLTRLNFGNIGEEEKKKLKSKLYSSLGVLLIVSTIVVFSLWIHIGLQIKEDNQKAHLLENLRTYFTEDTDVVSNSNSFPNSWNKMFMELDCCAVNPVFSTTNDFDLTPWCTTSGECQQTNSQIPKTCCKGVTVNTYASAPSDCHANVDVGAYNTKGCYEVLVEKIYLHSSIVIAFGVLISVFGVLAVVTAAFTHWKCKVCNKVGHNPGSNTCEYYEKQDDNVIVLHSNDVLSNFYTADIIIDGDTHKSAEHAFQLTKAKYNNNNNAVERIRTATTALEAKGIGDTVKTNSMWENKKKEVMSKILQAKFNQVQPFREKVTKCSPECIIVEATIDDFWGSGLNKNATLNTKPHAWPGKNTLGQLILSLKDCRPR